VVKEIAILSAVGDRVLRMEFSQARYFGLLPLPTVSQREYSTLEVNFLDQDMLICRAENDRAVVFIKEDPFYEIGGSGGRRMLEG